MSEPRNRKRKRIARNRKVHGHRLAWYEELFRERQQKDDKP